MNSQIGKILACQGMMVNGNQIDLVAVDEKYNGKTEIYIENLPTGWMFGYNRIKNLYSAAKSNFTLKHYLKRTLFEAVLNYETQGVPYMNRN